MIEKTKTAKCRGGLLFLEPGLGKTLISVGFAVNQAVERLYNEPMLVLCPAQLVPVWIREFDVRVKPTNSVDVRTYADIQKQWKKQKATPPYVLPPHCNVVVASYSALVLDRNKAAFSVLMRQRWSHVFLDEAHAARNQKGKSFHAVNNVIARFKWVITATPVMNKLNELHAYIRFIKLAPYSTNWVWNKDIVELAESNAPQAFAKVEELLTQHAIRMQKSSMATLPNMPPLQPKHVVVAYIEPTSFELQVYESIRVYCEERVTIMRKLFFKHKGGGQRYLGNGLINPVAEKEFQIRNMLRMHMIAMITKLRRAACHALLPVTYFAKLPPLHQKTRNIQQLLESLPTNFRTYRNRFVECSLCMDAWAKFRFAPCHHCVCEKCYIRMTKSSVDIPCLRCDSTICHIEDLPGGWSEQEMAGGNGAECKIQEFDAQQLVNIRSSKLERLMQLILDPEQQGRKWLIISEWTTILRLVLAYVAAMYPDMLHRFVIMDGTSSVKKRAEMIDQFQSPSTPLQFALLSLTAMGVGVTLTAATRVVFFEPYWNVSMEEQAMDRCHRIGQRADVAVYHFQMKHTIEKLMFQMKEHKAMVSDAVSGKTPFTNSKANWVNNVRLFMASQVQPNNKPHGTSGLTQGTLDQWKATATSDSQSEDDKSDTTDTDEAEPYEIDLQYF